jgi:uncharacterized membrane protein YfcA
LEIGIVLAGLVTGFFSGLFGIGGGTILVPMLLFLGFALKEAIAISIMQMVFSSIYGSYLNLRDKKELLKDGVVIGIGGSIGGFISGFIVSGIDPSILSLVFTMLVGFSIYRIYKFSDNKNNTLTSHSIFKLLIIGFFIGLIAMSIGVGGSIMLTPILIGYMHFSLKNATSLGLFFVIFSSIAGFISFQAHDLLLYKEGVIVGLSSLFGVYLGVMTKKHINIKSYKYITLLMYVSVFVFMIFHINFEKLLHLIINPH